MAAFRNSVRGFRDIWRMEEAFRLEVLLLIVSVPAAFIIGSNALWTGALIASLLIVIIIEILNTAIEAVVDRIGPERHELSRVAKDLGSLAVLLSCLLPAIVWSAALYGAITPG
jgi:diacylglycerol kinase (ATP)